MNIVVQGHSGCQIDVVSENNQLYIYKSTSDPKYLDRLSSQIEKQREASKLSLQHIRVPEVYSLQRTSETTIAKMQYVYSKNFIEFFEFAGFEQVDYFIKAVILFVEHEITNSTLEVVLPQVFQNKFEEIINKVNQNSLYNADAEVVDIMDRCKGIFDGIEEMILPIGTCHGDLTLSNILFNGNNYYLIDFLDSFIETPLQDIVKIRQDTAYYWSQMMYTKKYDSVRLRIIFDKIDKTLDSYFANKYEWYRANYKTLQLMNILRILPYAKEESVITYLKKTLNRLLHE